MCLGLRSRTRGIRWCIWGNCGKSTNATDAIRCSVIWGLGWPSTLIADNSFLSQTVIDGRWCVKRSFSRSGCFYRSVNDNKQDNNGPTNLTLHPDEQFRNSAARVDGVKYFREDLGDLRSIPPPQSMRAHRYIKVIEIWKEFGIWGRFQALFREHLLEGSFLEVRESYHKVADSHNQSTLRDLMWRDQKRK